MTGNVIPQDQEWWKDLVATRECGDDLSINQTSFPGYEGYVAPEEVLRVFEIPAEDNVLPALPKPEEYEKWHCLNADFDLAGQGVWAQKSLGRKS